MSNDMSAHTCVSCASSPVSLKSCYNPNSHIDFRKKQTSAVFNNILAQAFYASPTPAPTALATLGGAAAANNRKLYKMVQSIITEDNATPAPTLIPHKQQLGDLTTLKLLRNIIQAGKTTDNGKHELSPNILNDVEKLLSDSKGNKLSLKSKGRDIHYPSGNPPTMSPTAPSPTPLGKSSRAELLKALMLENMQLHGSMRGASPIAKTAQPQHTVEERPKAARVKG